MTFIVSLAEDIDVVRQADEGQSPGRYGCVIAGLHAAPALIRRGGLEEGIAIQLSPLGSRALLRTPAGEFANLAVEGEDVLGRHISGLRERAQAHSSWSDRFRLVDEILARLMQVDSAVPSHLKESWRTARIQRRTHLRGAGGGAGQLESPRRGGTGLHAGRAGGGD